MGQQVSIVNDVYIDKNGGTPLTLYRAKEMLHIKKDAKAKQLLEWWICKEKYSSPSVRIKVN